MSELDTQESIDQVNPNDVTSSVDNSGEIDKDWKAEYEKAQSFIGKQSKEIGELRAKVPKDTTDNPTDKPDKQTEEPNPDDTSIDNVKKIVETSKLDWEEFEQDYYNNSGKLSDEMRQKAIEAGVSEQFIDKAISGMQQTAKDELSKVAEAVGGLDELNAVFKWVATDKAKLETVQSAFTAELPLEAARLMVKGLQNEMIAANGNPPSYVKGGQGGTGDSGLFESQAQVQVYLADPRADYKSPKYDPAYMNIYNDKLKRSKAAGLI